MSPDIASVMSSDGRFPAAEADSRSKRFFISRREKDHCISDDRGATPDGSIFAW